MQISSSGNQQNVTFLASADQSTTQGAKQAQTNAQPPADDTLGDNGAQDAGQTHPGFVKDEMPPPSENVGTMYHIDDDGKSHYVGYYPAPNPHPSNQGAQTPADVFARGLKDGATHPGQTVGEIADISNGDQTKSGEKADETLEKLPVIG